VYFTTPKSDMSVKSDKKKRKIFNLETEFDIIKRFDNDQSICMALGINEFTLRQILFKCKE
jgi:hypothetical protein